MLKKFAERREVRAVFIRPEIVDRALTDRLRARAGVESVEVIVFKPRTGRMTAYWRLMSGQSNWIAPYQEPSLRKELQAVAGRNAPYDEMVCDSLTAAPLADAAEAERRIFTAHNVEHEVWARLAANQESRWLRWTQDRESAAVMKYETEILARFDLTVWVSDRDADFARRRGWAEKTLVIENGVDDYLFQTQRQSPPAPEIIFLGAMDYQPNVDSAVHFARKLFPKIQSALSSDEAFLTIVGSNPAPAVQTLAALPRIKVTGTVEDVVPYLARGRVFIVPLRAGSGVRHKIMEAAAAGIPIVSTSLGNEGLEFVAGKHLLAADTDEEFVAAVVRLWKDPELGLKLAAEAREFARRRYNYDRLFSQWDKILT